MIGLIFENLTVILGLIGAGAATIFGFYLRRSGKKAAEAKHDRKRAKDMQTAKEVRDDVDASNPDDVYRRLDGWMRDDR